MMRKLLIHLFSKLLFKDPPGFGNLREEQYLMAMSKAYQNPAIQMYLRERENTLMVGGIDKLLKNQMNEAYGLAGQLLEVRMLRLRMQVCYNKLHGKASKPSKKTNRGHTQ